MQSKQVAKENGSFVEMYLYVLGLKVMAKFTYSLSDFVWLIYVILKGHYHRGSHEANMTETVIQLYHD